MGSRQSWRKLSFLHLGINWTFKIKRSIERLLFRVPLILNQAARFNFGFASNMVLLLWCVCGGLLLHMLEANFLTILLKPNYEKAVDTAKDVLDRGLTVIYAPGSEGIVELLKNSPDYTARTLAERTIVCKDWDECGWYTDKGLIPGVVKTGTSVLENGLLYSVYLVHGKWHRSKDRKGGENPFGSYMMNKKWPFEEDFSNHLIRAQQVSNAWDFNIIRFPCVAGWSLGE